MAKRTRVIDKGYQKIMREILKLDQNEVVIGVQASKSGSELVTIAAANEFGTMDGRIPQRSYLRSTLQEKRAEIAKTMESAYKAVVNQRVDAAKGRALIGTTVAALVQRKIVSLRTPPNAASTIRKKGSSNPLIDTGRLRQSITFVSRKKRGL